MIGFLRRLFNPCAHKWVEVQRYVVMNRETECKTAWIHVSCCEHCGEIKQTRIKA